MEQQLTCFLCKRFIPGGLDELAVHFRNTHGITINHGLLDTGFVCAQGCERCFVNFYDLRKHIKKHHR